MLTKLHQFSSRDQESVGRAEFKTLILDNIVLISRALRQQLIIPDFRGFTSIIEMIFDDSKHLDPVEGKVASYIPQLAKWDSNSQDLIFNKLWTFKC